MYNRKSNTYTDWLKVAFGILAGLFGLSATALLIFGSPFVAPETVIEYVTVVATATPSPEPVEIDVVVPTPEPLGFDHVITVTASTVGRGAFVIQGQLIPSTENSLTMREAWDVLITAIDPAIEVCGYTHASSWGPSGKLRRGGYGMDEECLIALEELGGTSIPRNGHLTIEAANAHFEVGFSSGSLLDDHVYDIYDVSGVYLGSVRPNRDISVDSACWADSLLESFETSPDQTFYVDTWDEDVRDVQHEYETWNTRYNTVINLCQNTLSEIERPSWLRHEHGNDQHTFSVTSPAGDTVSWEVHVASDECDVSWAHEWLTGTHRWVRTEGTVRLPYGFDAAPGSLALVGRGWECSEDECFSAGSVLLAFDENGVPHYYEDNRDANPDVISVWTNCDGMGPAILTWDAGVADVYRVGEDGTLVYQSSPEWWGTD
ncbi:hypothetical protein GF360_04045 [candidate division WWE3 bacterium]|nr:hypothetical protein [candidate division WWE3 bacterium]